MDRLLALLTLACLLGGCTTTFGGPGPSTTTYNPTPPANLIGGWYDGTGPRGNSAGGP